MAAVLKKRALAEYRSSSTQEENIRPAKRLQIFKRNKSSDRTEIDLSAFENADSINSAIQALSQLLQTLPLPPDVRSTAFQKLMKLLQEVVAKSENVESVDSKSTLRPILIGKIFSVLPKLITNSEVHYCLERIIQVTSNSSSNVVYSHGIHSAFTLVTLFTIDAKHLEQMYQMTLNILKNTTNYMVKVRCLEALGGISSQKESSVFGLLIEYISDHDNRVRTAALQALLQVLKRDVTLPPNLYDSVCNTLNDDYRCVRESALNCIVAIADKTPEKPVFVQSQCVRLVDHAFSQLCNSVNDVSVRVRTLAITLLGSLEKVSADFLHQTLDKKLMSNMRRKSSAHERAKNIASTGQWSTGKHWGNDEPLEEIDATSAQIISNGACGAFVHGLEDEFLEVRTASLESICKLAKMNAFFASQCLDFLVDMFNDEIEDVRLKAIKVLQDIARHIKLRPDQLDEILHALKDSWLEIRESLHTLLGTCQLCTTSCVTTSVDALLDNLRRYPQDKRSILKCFKLLGTNHPEMVLALVPQLLAIHPYFDGVEPNVQDSEYICKLILILNAAVSCSTILPLLEQHTLRHYVFLRDSMPNLVPHLKIDEEKVLKNKTVQTNTSTFLTESLNKIAKLERSSTQYQLTLYSTVQSDLERLAEIDKSIAPAATMAAQYIQCMHMFTKFLSSRNWLTPSTLSTQQSGALKANVDHLLRSTLKLRYSFSCLTPEEEACIRSLRIRTLALQLVYVVHGSTGSALGLCDNFLGHTDGLQRYLLQQNLTPDAFTEAVIQEISQLEEPRPGAVARILQPLLLKHKVVPLFTPFSNPSRMKMAWAEILEPIADSDSVSKLSSGLVVGIQLDAELWHIPELGSLKIRVSYPDQSSHLITPNSSDIRVVEDGCHRLLTTVLISAQVWSEACHVGISLVLDMNEQESLAGRRHPKGDDGATTVMLCQPVKVLVWPKQIKRGI